jgi:hypothetical protein
MKAPDTKTILNITLVIAIIVVGKKVGEALGLFKTSEDKKAEELDLGTTASALDTSSTAPVGLSLNPNYWKYILKSISDKLVSQGKNKLTGNQAGILLTISGTQPFSRENLLLGTKYGSKSKFFINNITKFIPIPEAIKTASVAIYDKIVSKKLDPLQKTYAPLAYKIYNSKGIFSDDPEIVNSVFQQLKSKLQISYLSDTYIKMYDKDLFTYLQQFLNTEEQTKIYNILKNKPLY